MARSSRTHQENGRSYWYQVTQWHESKTIYASKRCSPSSAANYSIATKDGPSIKMAFPTLDMSLFFGSPEQQQSFSLSLLRHLKSRGVAKIKNHGIPDNQISQLFELVKSLRICNCYAMRSTRMSNKVVRLIKEFTFAQAKPRHRINSFSLSVVEKDLLSLTSKSDIFWLWYNRLASFSHSPMRRRCTPSIHHSRIRTADIVMSARKVLPASVRTAARHRTVSKFET